MDLIKISIERDCDIEGKNGELKDQGEAILPDNQLDIVLQAFAATYGILKIPEFEVDKDGNPIIDEFGNKKIKLDELGNPIGQGVSLERNYFYCIRKYTEEVYKAFVINQAKKQLEKTVKDQIDEVVGNVIIT